MHKLASLRKYHFGIRWFSGFLVLNCVQGAIVQVSTAGETQETLSHPQHFPPRLPTTRQAFTGQKPDHLMNERAGCAKILKECLLTSIRNRSAF